MHKAVCMALALSGVACERVDDFTLEAGESYCGEITLGNQYRQGLSPRVAMRMTFDAAGIEHATGPGTLTTFDSGTEEQLLRDAPLRPIPPLSHDALSDLTFGDGRDRNFIYAVSASDAAAESLIAIVSLRSDDRIEVRLIRPGMEGTDDSGRTAIFGLFVLSRSEGACGFE